MTTASIYLQILKSLITINDVFFGSKAGVEQLGNLMSPKGDDTTLIENP